MRLVLTGPNVGDALRTSTAVASQSEGIRTRRSLHQAGREERGSGRERRTKGSGF